MQNRVEQGSTHFSLCCWVNGLVRSHVKLWIVHVLDQTAELDQAVGFQVVQRDIVQRGDLLQR